MKLVDRVKDHARGRWIQIITQVAKVDADILDTKHHPCPQCGGSDRFRAFNDFEDTGGLICNQCGTFTDGISSLEWLTGKPFREVVQLCAEILGLQQKKRSPVDPSNAIKDSPWSESLEATFLASKLGVSYRGLVDSGARMVSYQREVVMCWDIHGQDGSVVGYVLANAWGREMPIRDREGNVVRTSKYKIVHGSGPGFVGKHAVERLSMVGMVDRVWKVEGISDLLALQSIRPENSRDVVVTNSNGAHQDPSWMAGALSRAKEVIVVHDSDEPGQAGADLWVKRCSESGCQVRNVKLPYPIAQDHGKDLRDWINEGNNWGDLLVLVDRAEVVGPKESTGTTGDDLKIELAIHLSALKRIKLDVLFEDDRGRVRVYSMFTRKSSWINNLDKLQWNQLLQIAGPPAASHVIAPGERGTAHQLTMHEIRKAIAILASVRRSSGREVGIGCWRCLNELGEETDAILIVNGKHGSRWNGDKVLKRIESPRDEGIVMELGGEDWYNHNDLAKQLELAADVDWRRSHLEAMRLFFAKWNWQQESAPAVLVGLVLASWLQTLWRWRPLVDISGASGSGKSYLLEALGGAPGRLGIFGRLGFRSSKSTEAGLRQATGGKAHIILCDEFEASKEREKILQAIRSGSRGDRRTTGTMVGEHKAWNYQHIVWVAAIETGLSKQADANRFISLDLLPRLPGAPRIQMPSGRELWSMGLASLAIGCRCFLDSEALASLLMHDLPPNGDIRAIETFVAPVASIAAGMGYSAEEAKAMLYAVLDECRSASDDDTDTDEDALLDEIMTGRVHVDSAVGQLTVGRIIESESLRFDPTYMRSLETYGVAIEGPLVHIHTPTVVRKLLPHRTGSKISKIIRRVSESRRGRCQIPGIGRVKTIAIPLSYLLNRDRTSESVAHTNIGPTSGHTAGHPA